MSKFSYTQKGGTYIIAASGGEQMAALVRNKKETFTDFIEREAKAKGLKVVINGSFIHLSLLSRIVVQIPGGALDPSESTPMGQVIQDGKQLGGMNSTAKFNFSQNDCGTDKFTASLGNPPPSSCSAVGGVAPIIIGGMQYGAQNLYKKGVPSGAPVVGDVDDKYRPFLIRKSNSMFAAILARGSSVGKTAIGYSASKKTLIILSQPNGQPGLDADGIRTLFISYMATNAVFFDGSDSATLYYEGKFLVRPGGAKNEYLSVAVGFK